MASGASLVGLALWVGHLVLAELLSSEVRRFYENDAE
jgi:hypothetical protein